MIKRKPLCALITLKFSFMKSVLIMKFSVNFETGFVRKTVQILEYDFHYKPHSIIIMRFLSYSYKFNIFLVYGIIKMEKH